MRASRSRANVRWVVSDYAAALNVRFASKAEEEAYQVHPLHLEFLAQCSALWDRVAVYDFQ